MGGKGIRPVMLTRYDAWRYHGRDRVAAAIVLAVQVGRYMENPEYLILAVDDVTDQWRKRLDRLLEDWQRGRITNDEVDAQLCGKVPNGPSALHTFVDDYCWAVEEKPLPAGWPKSGGPEVTYEYRKWLAHVVELAQPDHPVHTSEDRQVGHDRGV